MKETWLKELKRQGFKYFVIKIDEFFDALNEDEIEFFNDLLALYNKHRTKKGKSAYNNYWIVNRDEKYANEVKRIIEENEGVKL